MTTIYYIMLIKEKKNEARISQKENKNDGSDILSWLGSTQINFKLQTITKI